MLGREIKGYTRVKSPREGMVLQVECGDPEESRGLSPEAVKTLDPEWYEMVVTFTAERDELWDSLTMAHLLAQDGDIWAAQAKLPAPIRVNRPVGDLVLLWRHVLAG